MKVGDHFWRGECRHGNCTGSSGEWGTTEGIADNICFSRPVFKSEVKFC